MNLDQKQNWLLPVPSSPSVLGLGRQFCHNGEVHSRSNFPRSRIEKTPNVDLGQKKNWLLSAPSSPSMHGLGRQFCPNAKVDSKSKCTNRKCDNDVDNQLDTLLPSPCARKNARHEHLSNAELAVVCTVSPSMIGLGRQYGHHAEVDSNQTTPTECATKTSATSSPHCCPRPVIEKINA